MCVAGFLTKGTAMSKINPPSFASAPPPQPAPPQRETVKYLPPPRRETLTYGARESGCTTVTFIIQPRRGVDDRLMIGLDEHNGEKDSRLVIRGGAEAKEIPSQLRWLADKIEKEIGKHDAPSINEYLTCHNSRGGGR
jgi:hypothetical protein